MMYHCSQLATAIRGEQWLDALNLSIIIQHYVEYLQLQY